MTTNREYLDELAYRGDGSLTDWFEQEHLEIVRCRDCMFFKEEPPEDAGFCMYWVDRVIFHDADGFCAWGERRES